MLRAEGRLGARLQRMELGWGQGRMVKDTWKSVISAKGVPDGHDKGFKAKGHFALKGRAWFASDNGKAEYHWCCASCGHRKHDLWGKEPHPHPTPYPLKQAAGVVVPWGRAGVMKVRRQQSSLQSKEGFAWEGERGGTSYGVQGKCKHPLATLNSTRQQTHWPHARQDCRHRWQQVEGP